MKRQSKTNVIDTERRSKMWVNIHYDVYGDLIYQCSNCKKLTNEDFPYCPYCGYKHKETKGVENENITK